jgi:hypothetical protein
MSHAHLVGDPNLVELNARAAAVTVTGGPAGARVPFLKLAGE